MLLSVLTTLVIAGLVYWLITLLPLPAPFPTVIRVVVIVALVLYILGLLLGHPLTNFLSFR